VSNRARLLGLSLLLLSAALLWLAAEGSAAAARDTPVPVRLVLPSIGIDALVVTLALTDDLTMPAPARADLVAWYSFSAPAGGDGNVVLAGHRDWQGQRGVFTALGQLQLEDEIWLQDTAGAWSHYRVVWSESYPDDAAPLEALLGPTERPALTLITCGGVFDRRRGRYLERRVVRADLTHVVPSGRASEPARYTGRDGP
jgi:sortase (surface protein transpeptidase)